MCGFVCVYDPMARLVPAIVLEKMTETLHHRGPDDYGFAASSADGIRAWRSEPLPQMGVGGVALTLPPP